MDGGRAAAPTSTTTTRRLRPRAAFAVIAMAGLAVVSPAIRSASDSYPLSTYPMFSRAVDADVDLSLVVGRTDDGQRVELSPRLIAGTDEVIVAGGTINIAVRGGRADQLCAEVAGRVAGSTRDDIATIEVVTDSVDSVAWYEGDRARSTELHASCAVPR